MRYFFHLHDGSLCEDEEGGDFPNDAAARAEALRGARDVMSAAVRDGLLDLSPWIEVVDENGRSVSDGPFEKAVLVRSA